MAYRLLSTIMFLLLTMSKPSDVTPQATVRNTADIRRFLQTYERESLVSIRRESEAAWAYATNITDHNKQIMLQEQLRRSEILLKQAMAASKFKLDGLDVDSRRQLVLIMDIGDAAQTDKEKVNQLNEAITKMMSIYSQAKVCLSKSECLALQPGLTRLLATSRDYDRLLAAWKGWRDATGPKIKPLFETYVTLKNEAIRMLGHEDIGAYWRSWYDMPTFEDDVRKLFTQIQPLYEQLHAYVRKRLMAEYGEDKFPKSGHIPAHLLGDMWSQQWDNLIEMMKPYRNKEALDITDELVKQNFTATKIFRTADDFFASLGLKRLTKPFWEKSMLEKPKDGREVVCHASAWDFFYDDDFRIKMCTDITHHSFIIVHHEMGHIQYYQQYKNQPSIYRSGANPGFHEAVGDTIALSVQTPEHMHAIGLLKTLSEDEETDINYQMVMALKKVAFLPFGYLVDQYRWGVFRGDTGPQNYTKHWWDLRCQYQGLSPPVPRSSDDFDPGAKYHIVSDVPYIRYFVSFVIQFQFHKAMCDAAGHVGPLHRCDIYNNKHVGTLLSNMLKMGGSKPWPEAMYKIIGQTKMDAKPLMTYFQPLMNFLLKDNGNNSGWDPHCPEGTFLERNDARFNAGRLWWPVIIVYLVSTLLKWSCET